MDSRITEQSRLQSLQASLQALAIRHMAVPQPMEPAGDQELAVHYSLLEQWSCKQRNAAIIEVLSIRGQLIESAQTSGSAQQPSRDASSSMRGAGTGPAVLLKWDTQASTGHPDTRPQMNLDIGKIALLWCPDLVAQLKAFCAAWPKSATPTSIAAPEVLSERQDERPPLSAAGQPFLQRAASMVIKMAAGVSLSVHLHRLQVAAAASQSAADTPSDTCAAIIFCVLELQLSTSVVPSAISAIQQESSHPCTSQLKIAANLLAGTTAFSSLKPGINDLEMSTSFGPDWNVQLKACLPTAEIGSSQGHSQGHNEAGLSDPSRNLTFQRLLTAFAPQLRLGELRWRLSSAQVHALQTTMAMLGPADYNKKRVRPGASACTEVPMEHSTAAHGCTRHPGLQSLQIALDPVTAQLEPLFPATEGCFHFCPLLCGMQA